MGYLVFGDVPDVLSFVGYAVICGMALWMFFYNRKADTLPLPKRCKGKNLLFFHQLWYSTDCTEFYGKSRIFQQGGITMKCPFCGYAESKVIDSRPTDENERIRRRRECMQCGKRFTTYEIIEDVPIIVVKKDKSREVFDRNKILKGMLRACEKRPVTVEALETAISEIETTLQSALDREVTSVRIGELIMEKLRGIDEVAYVRFASVYKEFDSASAFVDEISKLQ